MARAKASGRMAKTSKRGRPPTNSSGSTGENGVEKPTETLSKASKTIVKAKGKRGRPPGTGKKQKKRAAKASRMKKPAKKESENECDVSDDDTAAGHADTAEADNQEAGQEEELEDSSE